MYADNITLLIPTSRTENPKLKIKQTIAVIEEALRRSKFRVNQDKTLTILFSQPSTLGSLTEDHDYLDHAKFFIIEW